MKKLFIAVLSMATLASCFQSEVALEQAIDFNTYVGSTTKAIDPSIDNNSIETKKFYVWGTTQQTGGPLVSIFEEEEVSCSAGEWNYDVNHTKYWIAGNKYNFAAVVNGEVKTLENGLPKTIDYTADGVTDLLYARSTPDIVAKAVTGAKEYLKAKGKNIPIECEVRSLEDIKEVFAAGGVDRIMFDNFSVEQTREAVALVAGRCETESSGGITLETLRDYAETGVDFISVGALTHQIKSLDMSLKAC